MAPDTYRRNDLKSWFADVGFLYLIVAAFVVLIFALGSLRRASLSWEPADAARAAAADPPIGEHAADNRGR
jgi:hypothetical protein